MTYEKNLRIYMEGGNLNYELGKEAAEEDCANGEYKIMMNQPLSEIFGVDWARGFYDYVRAWEMTHQHA